MSATRRWIALSLALLALLSMGIVFRVFLMQNVVLPASLVIWAVIRVFLSIPQEAYWVALVFVAFVLGLRVLPMRSSSSMLKPDTDSRQPARRFEYWRRIISEASKSNENKAVVKDNLRELLINVIAQEEGKHPNAVREDFANRRLDLPQSLYAYLTGAESRELSRRFTPKLNKMPLLGGRAQSNSPTSGQKMADLLAFLETYAEIDHDSDSDYYSNPN